MLDFIAHPNDDFRVGDFLNQGFADDKWIEFRAAVAFVKRSGVQHVQDALLAFNSRSSTSVRISIGVDKGGTSFEGASDLLHAVGTKGKVWVFKNSNALYHPKIYLFKNEHSADVIIGSVNLTQGGLYENYEGSIRARLDLTVENDKQFLTAIETALDCWSAPTADNICIPLDASLLALLATSGDLPTEVESRESEKAVQKARQELHQVPSPFGRAKTSRAPKIAKVQQKSQSSTKSSSTVETGLENTQFVPLTFGMTLQNTDVGVGKKSKGASGRSPEVFIPILALDLKPNFWGWQTAFIPDTSKYVADKAWASKHASWIAAQKKRVRKKPRPLDKLDWVNVQVRLSGHTALLDVTIWFNPDKKDIRIRHADLRNSGGIDDIFLVRPGPIGGAYTYSVEVIPKTDARYSTYLARLTHSVPSSLKKIGYF